MHYFAQSYYLTPVSSADHILQKKQNLFEFLQGEAESSLERLHHCAERELQHHIDSALQADAHTDTGKRAFNDFDRFCVRLEQLTQSTRYYFENLIQAVEIFSI